MNSDRLEFELRASSDPRSLDTVEAYVRETLRHAALPEADAKNLTELVLAATRDAVAHAYPPGESGSITVALAQESGCLTIVIRDYGLPQDIARLESALHTTDAAVRRQALGLDWAQAADELHWVSYGPDGKALQIIKWLHETHITEQGGDLKPFAEGPPLAPEQEYEIRIMRPEEAVQVSQLMYKAYGSSYFNRDVYYPERVAALNASGEVVSFVAVDATGNLVGHYALERNQEGLVAEGGQAVVDPAHRGRHLLNRLKDAVLVHARGLRLIGMFGDAVTVHTITQKSDIAYGAHLACANLGISPKTEAFRGFGSTQPQRVTCLLYFLWLLPPVARTVHVPERHQDAVARLYANLKCPVAFGPPAAPEGHGELAIQFDSGAAKAMLHVPQIGRDTSAAIRHAKRELIERSHAEVLYVELPLSQPGTPVVMEALEKEGFSFIGIAPHFSTSGDLVRMVYLIDDLSSDAIHIQEDIGRWLVDYALAEHRRVAQGE